MAQLFSLGIMKLTRITLTNLSSVAFCFLVVMWPLSYFMNLSRSLATSSKDAPSDSIPISPHYRFGFEDGSMWLYTYVMPYRGSIIVGLDSDTNDPPTIIHEWKFGSYGFYYSVHFHRLEKFSDTACDLPGIYFRRFCTFDEKPPYTTLRMSLWYPVLLTAILPLLWTFRRVRLRFGRP